MNVQGDGRRLRSALFVDFDNVYLGLLRLDPAAADAFGGDPSGWLARLAQGEDDEGLFTRRFLVRTCYLNPASFARFRPFFTRAGFRVVDCPSLTQQGKNAADINIVLDAVDALNSATRYDEFVIVSADADFTPLALRCREADRRVTILTAGPVASAYRAVADVVLAADALAELVTGAAAAGGPEDPGDVVVRPSGTAGQPAGVPARAVDEEAQPDAASPPETERTAPGPPAALTPLDVAAQAVRAAVRTAPGPVTSAAVAQVAIRADPTLLASAWEGHGGFAKWLHARVGELGYHSRIPGYVWDRGRFTEADLPATTEEADDLTSLRRQIVRVTDVPALTAEQYARLFAVLADDLREQPFDRVETTKRVRDACRDEATGVGIGRGSVNFVIQGLLYSGTRLEAPVTARQLADAWAENVVALCRGARMELSDDEVAEVRRWTGGATGPDEALEPNAPDG